MQETIHCLFDDHKTGFAEFIDIFIQQKRIVRKYIDQGGETALKYPNQKCI
jgi:hypothetical protein